MFLDYDYNFFFYNFDQNTFSMESGNRFHHPDDILKWGRLSSRSAGTDLAKFRWPVDDGGGPFEVDRSVQERLEKIAVDETHRRPRSGIPLGMDLSISPPIHFGTVYHRIHVSLKLIQDTGFVLPDVSNDTNSSRRGCENEFRFSNGGVRRLWDKCTALEPGDSFMKGESSGILQNISHVSNSENIVARLEKKASESVPHYNFIRKERTQEDSHLRLLLLLHLPRAPPY